MSNILREIVKKAYGEYWERVENEVTEFGWYQTKNFREWRSFVDTADEKGRLLYNHIFSSKRVGEFSWIRPKSLEGFETNNGWTVLESENDLPTDDYGLYHVITKTDIYTNKPKNQNVEEFWKGDVNKNAWWMENITHYQKVKTPSKLPHH